MTSCVCCCRRLNCNFTQSRQVRWIFYCLHCLFCLSISIDKPVRLTCLTTLNKDRQAVKPALSGCVPCVCCSALTFRSTQTQAHRCKLRGAKEEKRNRGRTYGICSQGGFSVPFNIKQKGCHSFCRRVLCWWFFYCSLRVEVFIWRGRFNSFPADCGRKTFFFLMRSIVSQSKTTGG